jgi:APA family basic amino acid/polyamine antiporter
MARDGLFLPSVARVHPRTGSPVRAIALQAMLACGMVLLGSFDEIVGTFLFVTVLFIALTVAGGLRFRRASGKTAWPWTHALFLALSVVLLALILTERPLHALGGVALVALGLPVHVLFAPKATRHAP